MWCIWLLRSASCPRLRRKMTFLASLMLMLSFQHWHCQIDPHSHPQCQLQGLRTAFLKWCGKVFYLKCVSLHLRTFVLFIVANQLWLLIWGAWQSVHSCDPTIISFKRTFSIVEWCGLTLHPKKIDRPCPSQRHWRSLTCKLDPLPQRKGRSLQDHNQEGPKYWTYDQIYYDWQEMCILLDPCLVEVPSLGCSTHFQSLCRGLLKW